MISRDSQKPTEQKPPDDSDLQVALAKERVAMLLQQLYSEEKLKEREVNRLSRTIMSTQELLDEFVKLEEGLKSQRTLEKDSILGEWVLSKLCDPRVFESSPIASPTLLSTSPPASLLSSPSPSPLRSGSLGELKKSELLTSESPPASPLGPSLLSRKMSVSVASKASPSAKEDLPHYMTRDELVLRLLGADGVTKFLPIFMLNFRKAISPPDFFDKLSAHFHRPPEVEDDDDVLSLDKELEVKETKKVSSQSTPSLYSASSPTFSTGKEDPASLVRSRILNLMKKWLQEHFVDDFPAMKKKLLDFLAYARATGDTVEVRALWAMYEDQENFVASENLPRSQSIIVVDKKLPELDVLTIKASETARELTLLEFPYFQKIRSIEFTDHRWKDKNMAPNAHFFIEEFNRMTYWMSTEILERKALVERVAVMQYFISVGSECLRLRNFHITFAVVAAIQSVPIGRLKKLQGVLDSSHQRMLEEISKITSSDDNYKAYRSAYKACRESATPCLPHLGVLFKDLFVFEEVTAHEKEHRLIDIHRWRRVSQEITQTLATANRDFPFKSNAPLQSRLRGRLSRAKTAEQLLEMSLQIEPKRSWQQHKEHMQEMAINVLLEEGFL